MVAAWIIGDTQSAQAMATWVLSRNAAQTLTNDLRRMTGGSDSAQIRHKEEDTFRIQRDTEDRNSIRKTLEPCSDPMDPDSHEDGVLLNISTGQIAQPEVNVDRSLEIGKEQLNDFETTWPEGFYCMLSKHVVTFESHTKMLLLDITKSWIRRPYTPESYVLLSATGILTYKKYSLVSWQPTHHPCSIQMGA